MTKDMKLNERLKQELTDYKGLRSDLSFVHRGRVYQSPIWSIERGAAILPKAQTGEQWFT